MRVVLDTNVLVSAILTPGGSAHQVVQLVLRGDLQLCVDGRIVEEYREVLNRGEFKFSAQATGMFLGSLLEEAQQVFPTPVPGRFPDDSDRAFVEVALGGQAEALITGNVRHFRAAESRGVAVKPPGEFLTWWRRK